MRLSGLLLLCNLVAHSSATKDVDRIFLEKNQKKTGITTLPSGLQYRVIESGQGKVHPLPSTECSCHYEGRTVANYPHGKKFDSSFDRGEPASFAPNQVIPGVSFASDKTINPQAPLHD